MGKLAIKVPVANDKSKGDTRFMIHDISNYRAFTNDDAPDQSVITVSSGKSFVCDIDIESLDNLIGIN